VQLLPCKAFLEFNLRLSCKLKFTDLHKHSLSVSVFLMASVGDITSNGSPSE